MRRSYKISDETIKVINGHARTVAIEYGCEEQYIFSILSNAQTDPFAKFEWLFRSAVKAGCNVLPWMSKLEHIRDSYLARGLCVKEETAATLKEFTELNSAVLNDKSLYVQLSEALDLREQADRNVKAIMDAIHKDKDTGFNVREMGKAAVSRYRGAR